MPKVPERPLSPGEILQKAKVLKKSRKRMRLDADYRARRQKKLVKKSRMTVQYAERILDKQVAKKLAWIKEEE